MFDKINSAPEEEILVQIDNVALQKNVMKSLADPKLEDGPQKYLQDDVSAFIWKFVICKSTYQN